MKKKLFLLVSAMAAGVNLFAQDTIPALTIDSTLHVGDSAIFRDVRVQGNTMLRGEVTAREFIVEENALFYGNMTTNGNIFYNNAPAFSGDFEDKEILVYDPVSKLLEKSGLSALEGHIYSKHCESVGGVVTAPVWNNGPNKLYVSCPEVRVGVGTDEPSHSLHVVGPGLFQSSVQAATAGVGGEPSTFSRFRVTNANYGAAIEANNTGNTYEYNKLVFLQYDNPSTEVIKVVNTQTGHMPFFLEASGRMTIHNGTQKIFQLNPDGVLQTRTVKVDTYNWPDYVFEPDYALTPLDELKAYVAAHGHLPNIPSAEQVAAEGVNVAEMDKALTRTVEEMYLYILQLEERIRQLEAKN